MVIQAVHELFDLFITYRVLYVGEMSLGGW